MEPYLNTSDVDAVKALARIFPLAGVTINPSIVAAGNQTLEALLPQLQEAMRGQGRLFTQMMTATVEGVVNDMRKLRAIAVDIMTKVPVTAEDLTATKLLKKEGTPTLSTVAYGAAQGLLAALAGAKCVTSYTNCADAQGGDSIQTVTDLQMSLEMHVPYAKVLATSSKTPRQALDCLLADCELITLPLGAVQQMTSPPVVDAVAVKSEHDQQNVSGRMSIRCCCRVALMLTWPMPEPLQVG